MQFTYYAAFNYGSAVVIYNNEPSNIHRKVPGIIKILPTPPNITLFHQNIKLFHQKVALLYAREKIIFQLLETFTIVVIPSIQFLYLIETCLHSFKDFRRCAHFDVILPVIGPTKGNSLIFITSETPV